MQKQIAQAVFGALLAIGATQAAQAAEPVRHGVLSDEQIAAMNKYGTTFLNDSIGTAHAYNMTYYVAVMQGISLTVGELYFHKHGELPTNFTGQNDNVTRLLTEDPYFKIFQNTADVHINRAVVEGGSSAADATIANMEYFNVPEGQEAKLSVGTVELSPNSVLRVVKSRQTSEGVVGQPDFTATFSADKIVMAGDSAVVFSGQTSDTETKYAVDNKQIGEIWAGYVRNDAGQYVLDDQTGTTTTGILTQSDDPTAVKLGTVHVGNTSFLTNASYAESALETDRLYALEAPALAAADATKGITFEIDHANAVVALGEVGTSGAPTDLHFNINVDGYAQPIAIEKMHDGASVTMTAPGSDQKTGEEIAMGLASGLSIGDIEAAAGTTGTVSTQIDVTQHGIYGGVTYAFDVVDQGDSTAQSNPVLVGTTKNTVTTALSEIASLSVMEWRAEMNHMQYRMGELRDHAGFNNGVWARAYQGKDKYGDRHVENEYFGFQAGYDRRIAPDVVLGAAVSYSQGDSTFDDGSGDNYTLALTGYGTWMAENGMFLDGTLKYGRIDNDIDMHAVNGAEQIFDDASYNADAVSATLEAGWRFPLAKSVYLEPQLEMMYGRIFSEDYSYSAYDVSIDDVDMLVGRAGFMVGVKCPANKGSLYLRSAVLHDFQGETSTTYRYGTQHVTIDDDLGGTWYEIGVGGQYNVSDAAYVYADVQYADGGEIETPWRWSLGVRYAF